MLIPIAIENKYDFLVSAEGCLTNRAMRTEIFYNIKLFLNDSKLFTSENKTLLICDIVVEI